MGKIVLKTVDLVGEIKLRAVDLTGRATHPDEWHGDPEAQRRINSIPGIQPGSRVLARRVDDGNLAAIVSCDPFTGRWHLSISHPKRHPTWDEISEARYSLLPNNITVALLLPPRREYVNVHEHCFHLYEIEKATDA